MTSIKHKSTPLIGYEIERGHIERKSTYIFWTWTWSRSYSHADLRFVIFRNYILRGGPL